MKKPFKTPNESKVWKIKKIYSPAYIGGQPRSSDDLWVKLVVYFSLEGNMKSELVEGIVAVENICQANVYRFGEYLCLTPAVEGIIRELEALQYGLSYQNNSGEDTIARLICGASLFWH